MARDSHNKPRSQISEERRERRIRLYFAIFVVFLMSASSIAYFFTPDDSKTKYNGYTLRAVVNEQGNVQGYATTVDKRQLLFSSLPAESASIELPPGMIDAMMNAQIIVWRFDPESNATPTYDLFRFDMGQTILKQQTSVLSRPSDKYSLLPVLDCGNATSGYPFIELRDNITRSITYENGCYVLEGSPADFRLLRDRIVYRYYNITRD